MLERRYKMYFMVRGLKVLSISCTLYSAKVLLAYIVIYARLPRSYIIPKRSSVYP